MIWQEVLPGFDCWYCQICVLCGCHSCQIACDSAGSPIGGGMTRLRAWYDGGRLGRSKCSHGLLRLSRAPASSLRRGPVRVTSQCRRLLPGVHTLSSLHFCSQLVRMFALGPLELTGLKWHKFCPSNGNGHKKKKITQ